MPLNDYFDDYDNLHSDHETLREAVRNLLNSLDDVAFTPMIGDLSSIKEDYIMRARTAQRELEDLLNR